MQKELVNFFEKENYNQIIKELKENDIYATICSYTLKVQKGKKFYNVGIIKNEKNNFM